MTTPAAPRRQRRSSESRRADVLAAARRLFAARGFHATTTRELADVADINDALLYRYFPNKEAVLAALADEAVAAFSALPSAPPGLDLPLADLLELVGTAFVRTATDHIDLLTILIGEHQTLADDHRFVEFIHTAASGLGAVIEETTGGATGTGYLAARAYMGSLIAFVLLQNVLGLAAVHPVNPADYIRQTATTTAAGLLSMKP